MTQQPSSFMDMIGSSVNYSSILQTTNEFRSSKIFTSLWWWGHVWLPLIVALLSFVFFRFFQFAVRWYLFGKWTFPTFSYFKRRRRRRPNSSFSTPSMDSKSLEFVPPNKKWRISNEFVSLFHSILSGVWALGILTHFDSYIDDLIGADSKEARYLTYMSLGYMVHDLIDLVVNERSARIIELLFHHVVVITAFMITQVTGKFLYIVVLGLLMEVNSIFLHLRSLCNLYRQPKDSNLFKIIALINVATFMLFRIAVSVVLIGWLISQYINWELAWHLQVVNSLVIYSLGLTNFVLCYRVLAADGLLGKSRARRQQPHDDESGRTHRQSLQQQQQESEDDDDDEEEGGGGANGGDDEDEGLESDYNNGNGTANTGAERLVPAHSRSDIEAGRAVAATQQQPTKDAAMEQT
uniref:TLC domain-containing protein n=1 Tax=Globodera rostochiensis TaxID=31243 RepID=A0A914HET2_GLORO